MGLLKRSKECSRMKIVRSFREFTINTERKAMVNLCLSIWIILSSFCVTSTYTVKELQAYAKVKTAFFTSYFLLCWMYMRVFSLTRSGEYMRVYTHLKIYEFIQRKNSCFNYCKSLDFFYCKPWLGKISSIFW